MNIYFDVDQTLIFPMTRSLRPYAKWCIDNLKKAGHSIYIWSRRGEENCWDIARLVGVSLDNCANKPPLTNLKRITHLSARPHFCIDDDPEDVIRVWPGMLVLPYCFETEEDKEMLRVLDSIAPNSDEREKAIL